jgi:hypothetical protein
MAVSPPQWDNLPAGLKELRHWVLWKTAMRDGRLTKVPIRADSGLNAEADNQTTWTTFDKVREAFEKGRGSALGVGFVFARSSEISGVDLDHCRDPATGEIDAWAKAYLDRLNSYPEISPSGAGLHVLVKGSIPVTGADGGRQKKLTGDGYRPDAAIEMYSAKRFFTMTGNVLPGYPQGVESRQDELMAIYEEVFGKVEPPQSKTQGKAQDGPKKSSTKRTVDDKAHLPDEAVIARMLGSVHADEIEKLLRGDISAYENDDSRADQALCNHFAFWTANNRQQMDRIFRTSKLMRPKWDEKRGNQTYGEKTIDKAIRGTKDTYQPDADDEEDQSSQPVDEEDEPQEGKKSKKGRPSTITLITRMLLGHFRQDEGSRLVINGAGKAYLWIAVGDHRQMFDLDSEEFRVWLAGLFAERYKGAILRTSSIKDGKEALISQLMRIRKPVKMDLQVKTIMQDDAIYYDLGSEDWRCVKISPSAGVEIVPAPLGLRRTRAQGAQVMPDLTAKPDDLDLLTEKMRITNEADKLLVKAIACAGIVPDIAHPILWMTGGQGSGKSLRAKMLKSVIDPAVPKQTSLPDTRKDLGVLLSNCHCLVLDNVDSPFTSWQVEMLCQAVTGGASVARELFSNGEIAINVFNRGVLIFTSIGVVTNAPDLLDRGIILPVDDIPAEERRSEVTIMREFDLDKPKILGALFESIRRALAIIPQVEAEFERGEWPQQRMADFTIFGEALARAAWGKEPGAFLEAYRKRINDAASEIVGGDLAMATLQELMLERIVWTGTAKMLLKELETAIRYDDPGWQPPSRGWPRTPNSLGMKIKKYSTDLARQGIAITNTRVGDQGTKMIEIELVARDTPADDEEESNIKQILEDHERRGAPIRLIEFADKNKFDKLACGRLVHSRKWTFDITSKSYSPPYRR